MTTQDRKVAVGQALVKTASIDAEYVKDADGNKVRIGPGETVKAGPPEVEVQGTQSWTWVHIEQGDKKGYIEERFLDDADADIAKLPAVVIFEEEVSRTQFAEACFTHALIADANTAFLYALAFAESGAARASKAITVKRCIFLS